MFDILQNLTMMLADTFTEMTYLQKYRKFQQVRCRHQVSTDYETVKGRMDLNPFRLKIV